MNILLFGDLHLTQQDLPECQSILEEIIQLAEEHKIDLVIDLGDTFDQIKPTSQELDVFSDFLNKLNRKTILISAQSHESENFETSVLNHFGILKDNVQIVKSYEDDNHLFCGHFIVKEAKKNFGATISKSELKYNHVFLGHQHSFEKVSENIYQLGSVRWVDFAEAEDKEKVVAIITDYKEKGEKVHFIPLKSPIPMISLILEKADPLETSKEAISDTISSKKGEIPIIPNKLQSPISSPINPARINKIDLLCQKFDKLPEKTKVRVIFRSYELWREFLPLQQKYKDKFTLFREKKEFLISTTNQIGVKKETINLSESLNSWFEKNNIPEPIKKVLKEEVK